MSELTHPRSLRGKTQLFLVILIFAGIQLVLTLHLRMNSMSPTEPEPEKIEAFNPKLFEMMSFGQLPAVVDWMWLKTLQDPLLTHVKKGTHPAIFYTLDLITQLDPAFYESYIAGATLVSVVRDDGEGAMHLLTRGEEFRQHELARFDQSFRERFWSQEWRIPLLMAYVYLFDLDDMPHAEEAYRKASLISDAPAYLKPLMEQLGRPGGRYKVGLRLIDLMIASNAKNPDVKEKLLVRRESLKVNYFLYDLNERFHNFLDSRHVSQEDLRSGTKADKYWQLFKKSSGFPGEDPWGGLVSVSEEGRIVTTTEHRKVFGLE